MPDPRPQAMYASTQSELYAICTIGWNSYAENQPDFEAFNTLYTALYGTDAQAEVDAALNLPGFQERNEAAEISFVQLNEAHALCILKWKSLRSYIKSSYPSEFQKAKIESAGYDHYAKAANKNWDETTAMLTAGQHFIDNNTADLTTGGMPAAFTAEYTDAFHSFTGLYSKFTDFEQDEQEGTDLKLNANNKIYSKLIRMFEDAQIIYEHDPSKRERFVFAQVKKLITNPGNAGSIPADTIVIKGVVSDLNTDNAIANASINTTPDGSTETFSAVTDSDGAYELTVSNLPDNSAGTLQVNATALDYNPISLQLDYSAGNGYDLNFQLEVFIELEPPVDP